ncbi:hypothetical protein F5Y04DRAFT_282510 [Hypomontagnella monticulosa]|nr:hypothetical protein F5Y04DRAFT_282510 [Hypomontagnella monticulosa]
MCHDWNQEYTECPTYHKQQSSAKGFLGRLFLGHLKHKKHCGRVVPHYADPEPFCPHCTVKVDRLRAKQVGDGALKVYRPSTGDTWCHSQEYVKKKSKGCRDHDSAGRVANRLHKRPQHGTKKHGQMKAKTAPEVWIPGLYEQPQSLARKETYSRAATAAPPVSQRPSGKLTKTPVTKPVDKSAKEGKKSSARGQSSKESHRQDRGTRTKISPKNESSRSLKPQPPPKPAPAYHRQHDKAVAGKGLPTSGVQPLGPPIPRRKSSSYWKSEEQRYLATKALPPLPRCTEDPRLTTPPKPHHTLRHKQGKVHKISHPNQPYIAPLPLPEYQVYLNALNYAADNTNVLSERRRARMSRSNRKSPEPQATVQRNRHHGREWPKRPTSIRRAIGIGPGTPASNMSDESFMCQSSRQLTYNDVRYI